MDASTSPASMSNVHSLKSKVSPFLLLVGDGPERGRIEEEMRRQGVADRCHITGMQSDVLPWLQEMDIFCLSSDTEGLSISLVEAGACGLPSVVTDVGGNREVVVEGETGLLTPKGDEAALAAALEKLTEDRSLRRRIGLAARKRIAEHFSLDQMTAEYRGVYEGGKEWLMVDGEWGTHP